MNQWIDPNVRTPEEGVEVRAVITGSHGGIRYDHDEVSAIYDGGSWYLDDGVVDEDGGEETFAVLRWMMPDAEQRDGHERALIDAGELLNRLVLISATAGQWSGPRVIREVIEEVRGMMKQDDKSRDL